jgi:hypothetical protein
MMIASVCSLLALSAGLYLGSLVLLMFDHNIHDEFAPAGGLIIGLIVGVLVFRIVLKRLSRAEQ